MLEGLLARLGITKPIVLAPMAGGVGTPALCAAVSNHGGLGSLPAGYKTPDEMELAVRKTRSLTRKPFAVNIFIPEPPRTPSQEDLFSMKRFIDARHQELGLPELELQSVMNKEETSTEEWVDFIIANRIPIVSTTFGTFTHVQAKYLKKASVKLLATVTSTEEGFHARAMGYDAIIAQGSNAGGHSGAFFKKSVPLLQETDKLVQQNIDSRLGLPIIATGGIRSGDTMHRLLNLGAEAVQLGSAFLACKESGASELHKQAVAGAKSGSTCLTKSITGRQARALKSPIIEELEQLPHIPYPLLHYFTALLRKTAVEQRRNDRYVFWCGEPDRHGEQIPEGLAAETVFDSLFMLTDRH